MAEQNLATIFHLFWQSLFCPICYFPEAVGGFGFATLEGGEGIVAIFV